MGIQYIEKEGLELIKLLTPKIRDVKNELIDSYFAKIKKIYTLNIYSKKILKPHKIINIDLAEKKEKVEKIFYVSKLDSGILESDIFEGTIYVHNKLIERWYFEVRDRKLIDYNRALEELEFFQFKKLNTMFFKETIEEKIYDSKKAIPIIRKSAWTLIDYQIFDREYVENKIVHIDKNCKNWIETKNPQIKLHNELQRFYYI